MKYRFGRELEKKLGIMVFGPRGFQGTSPRKQSQAGGGEGGNASIR
jgi:hypothetical protein